MMATCSSQTLWIHTLGSTGLVAGVDRCKKTKTKTSIFHSRNNVKPSENRYFLCYFPKSKKSLQIDHVCASRSLVFVYMNRIKKICGICPPTERQERTERTRENDTRNPTSFLMERCHLANVLELYKSLLRFTNSTVIESPFELNDLRF